MTASTFISQDEMLETLGSPLVSQVVARFRQLAFIPPNFLAQIAREALSEKWGNNNFALEKYLSVHIPWAIEQNAYTYSGDQLFFTAGHLQTRYGTPIYIVFERHTGQQPQKL